MSNLYNLKDKKIFITGGTGGIGSTTVKNFIQNEDAEVFFTSSSQKKIDKLMPSLNNRAYGAVCDMANFEQIIQTVKDAIEKMGGIDVLVCNAGTNIDKLFLRMTMNDWMGVMNVNLNGNFQLVSQAIKAMFKKRSGRIIFIGSVIASMGNMGQVNYAASKAALEGMARSLALEGSKFGVNVNVIAPGFIETEMTAKIPEEMKKASLERIPLGHYGSTQDIYEMIAFLSSDAAKYITGQTIHVNGGLYI